MSIWSRVTNVFRRERMHREIDEEIQSHIEEAIAEGRDPAEARKAFGSALRKREESRDFKLIPWLDSLRSDLTFGARQLMKNRAVTASAILSLGLALGACTSAFRLIDALLLRPLPVSIPERLVLVSYEYRDHTGKVDRGDSFEYPHFRVLRAAIKDDAEAMAIDYNGRTDVTFGSDQEMERAYRQHVSGWMFGALGLEAAVGRVLTESDDLKPGAHPYAVLSYEYWSRRFGRDPAVVGRTVRIGANAYEIVGVLKAGFPGTETGSMTDIYVPTMMNAAAINESSWSWFRTWVKLKPGVDIERVRQKIQAAFTLWRKEKVKGWNVSTPRQRLNDYVSAPLFLEPAAAGVSGLQRNYRRSLPILAMLVGLVLLIACFNVANLMTAQAAARAREMALRVSIGAGKARLVQLVLAEGVLLAVSASAFGCLFAWWSAPWVVSRINPPDSPARLLLPADWRVLAFTIGLSVVVTLLFGLAPALRASGVKPVAALKGGEDPHARRRLMNVLVAAQVSFCFLVHFVAGLFTATFDRLSNQPVGFSTERLLILQTTAKGEQPSEYWDQVVRRLRERPDVEAAAMSHWALMSGAGWSNDVWANGKGGGSAPPAYLLGVGPEWLKTMKIPLLEGRDLLDNDVFPKVGIVNQTFAKHYFEGKSPVGRTFEVAGPKNRVTVEIVGLAADARYRNMREAIRPTIYVPFGQTNAKGEMGKRDWPAFVVRTTGADPMRIAPSLRQEVSRERPEFRVSNIRTQDEMVRSHTVRERLLAMLSLFFATVALVLAAVGLYGVLNYAVLQRRREIGIRMALGALPGDVARRVTTEVFAMLAVGAVLGLAAGVGSERYLETLLYEVKATEWRMLALPSLTILAMALLAALPPVIRAVRIDPALMLRAE